MITLLNSSPLIETPLDTLIGKCSLYVPDSTCMVMFLLETFEPYSNSSPTVNVIGSNNSNVNVSLVAPAVILTSLPTAPDVLPIISLPGIRSWLLETF